MRIIAYNHTSFVQVTISELVPFILLEVCGWDVIIVYHNMFVIRSMAI
jgi:hypothetical protein